MEFSECNWATISETICPQMLIFRKQASWSYRGAILKGISLLSSGTWVACMLRIGLPVYYLFLTVLLHAIT